MTKDNLKYFKLFIRKVYRYRKNNVNASYDDVFDYCHEIADVNSQIIDALYYTELTIFNMYCYNVYDRVAFLLKSKKITEDDLNDVVNSIN